MLSRTAGHMDATPASTRRTERIPGLTPYFATFPTAPQTSARPGRNIGQGGGEHRFVFTWHLAMRDCMR